MLRRRPTPTNRKHIRKARARRIYALHRHRLHQQQAACSSRAASLVDSGEELRSLVSLDSEEIAANRLNLGQVSLPSESRSIHFSRPRRSREVPGRHPRPCTSAGSGRRAKNWSKSAHGFQDWPKKAQGHCIILGLKLLFRSDK